jgi:hypothetical protein
MYTGLTEKQVRNRMRFLSDKMEAIWEKISPELNEFDELRFEFKQLYTEMDRRGLLDAPQPGENVRKTPE